MIHFEIEVQNRYISSFNANDPLIYGFHNTKQSPPIGIFLQE